MGKCPILNRKQTEKGADWMFSINIFIGSGAFLSGLVEIFMDKPHFIGWFVVLICGIIHLYLGIHFVIAFRCKCCNKKLWFIILTLAAVGCTVVEFVVFVFSLVPKTFQKWFCDVGGTDCSKDPIMACPAFPIILVIALFALIVSSALAATYLHIIIKEGKGYDKVPEEAPPAEGEE